MRWQDEPYDQWRLPWATAPGEPVARVLHVSELEAWAAARAKVCGHVESPLKGCAMCLGTMHASAALGCSDRVNLIPAT
jgi:hypothetical protein